jgi:hypothetical protein
MRLILLILASISFLSPKAQSNLPAGSMNYKPRQPYRSYNSLGDSSILNQKWYISKYAGFSAGFGYFNGGSAMVLSAPVGLQLNHPLNDNLIAFTGISVSPAFFSFGSSFTNPVFNKSYPSSNPSNTYGFGMNSRVEMGLMYINDAKTFSLSGSIGIERNSYPVYPSDRMNTKKQ